MINTIPQIQTELLALYDTTFAKIADLSAAELADLQHLADDARRSKAWTARTAAEIVSVAIRTRGDL